MSWFSFTSPAQLPLWKLLFDSLLALAMWILILRFIVLIFAKPNSNTLILKQILAIGERLLRWFSFLIPKTLNERAHELYLAFCLFMLRYYVLPLIANYDIGGFSLPFEQKLLQLWSLWT